MKVAIVGCTHAGTAVVQEIINEHPDTEVHVFERRPDISFLSCGIYLYLQGTVARLEDMFYADATALAAKGANIHFHLETDVIAIHADTHQLEVEDLKTQALTTYAYDKLVMTTGSYPIATALSGTALPRVLMCKNYDDAQLIKKSAADNDHVAIIGGGYIGVELAEAYSKNQKQVTLINGIHPLLSHYADEAISTLVAKDLIAHGVVIKNQYIVEGFDSTDDHVFVQTDHGEIEADMAVLSVGFRPMTELLVGQVKMTSHGAIHVNDYMQTSDPDIYAAGDAVAVHFNPTGKDAYAPLATNAVRQGKLVGINLFGLRVRYLGTQSTSALQLYEKQLSTSGLTLANAERNHFDAASVTMTENYRPEFMPTTTPITMSLVYDRTDRRILGAQFYSRHDISDAANIISVMIQNHNTIDELAYVDMLFNPNFDKPWHYLNLLGQRAVMQADNDTL